MAERSRPPPAAAFYRLRLPALPPPAPVDARSATPRARGQACCSRDQRPYWPPPPCLQPRRPIRTPGTERGQRVKERRACSSERRVGEGGNGVTARQANGERGRAAAVANGERRTGCNVLRHEGGGESAPGLSGAATHRCLEKPHSSHGRLSFVPSIRQPPELLGELRPCQEWHRSDFPPSTRAGRLVGLQKRQRISVFFTCPVLGTKFKRSSNVLIFRKKKCIQIQQKKL
ncbi:uncharacterized protein LOC121233524 [Aquila chrysaetos chrysaetos]|uniref:uncharacterized protein LOC121233524 n=1 Tax=Aquila chrysaetos chrysaetos TaxID=223781 RepID=UPI001B7D4491|nr:uncharacterized protein LOC121233524 [Aquila chrysaetos chrysaetos]